MDEIAVVHSESTVLKRLGVKTEGDVIRLKLLCSEGYGSVEAKKKELKEIISNGSSSAKMPKMAKLSSSKIKSRIIYVSWKVYDRKQKRYVLVKADRGGGLCKLVFELSSTKDVVLNQIIEHFWNNKKADVLPSNSRDHYHFFLTDGKGDTINDFLNVHNSWIPIPFTVADWCDQNKQSRPRLFLMTKHKLLINDHLSSSSEDFEQEKPATSIRGRPSMRREDNAVEHVANSREINVSQLNSTPVDTVVISDSMQDRNSSPVQSTPALPLVSISPIQPNLDTAAPIISNQALIGTNEERLNLRNEIDAAYQKSLEIDRQKQVDMANVQRLTSLMEERKSKVKPEPDLHEDHVVIRIRHPFIGQKSRLFREGSKMTDCYWWAGSLSIEPEFFHLTDYTGKTIYPDSPAKSGVYNMKPVEEAVNLSEDGEVAFDEFTAESTNSAQNKFEEIERLRLRYKEKLIPDGSCLTVKRDNIYEDMLNAYKKRGITKQAVKISFVNEDAVGDGVSRDAYGHFFQSMYDLFEGENEKLPSIHIDEDALELIGKIITHSFILHGQMPLKICRAALKKHLFTEISDEELLQSFLNFLPNRECQMIKEFAQSGNVPKQHIIDILSESKVYSNPTQENVLDLCKKAASITLIKLPFLAVSSLAKGMGEFWKQVTPEMFDEIYETKATPERVVASLDAEETCAQDAKILTYLHRFIRACTHEELETFLRFVTGSFCLSAEEKIKVSFHNQPHEYLAPKATTCFKILHLPRGYSSFAQLRDNLKMCMKMQETWSIYDEDQST